MNAICQILSCERHLVDHLLSLMLYGVHLLNFLAEGVIHGIYENRSAQMIHINLAN